MAASGNGTGMGRRTSRRGRRGGVRPIAEINVTPFVDVMLVLLVIFMVAAPMLTVGVPLNLPDTAAESVPTEQEEPLTLSIPAEGPMLLMTAEIPDDQLVARLSAVAEQRQSRRIYLRGDSSLAYGRMMQVMGALNAAGFNDLVLVTDAGGPRLDAPAAD